MSNQPRPTQSQPPQPQITPEIAVQKFKTYLSKVNLGELEPISVPNWTYYESRYLNPFFQKSSQDFVDALIEVLLSPKTRLNAIGGLWFFLDHWITILPQYIPLFSTKIVSVFQWCLYRVLYQKLIANFVRSRGLPMDTTILNEQKEQIEKVIAKWNKPNPTPAQRAEFAKKNSILHNELFVGHSTVPNELILPPVFPQNITDEINNAHNELQSEYNNRLNLQENQFVKLNQEYQQQEGHGQLGSNNGGNQDFGQSVQNNAQNGQYSASQQEYLQNQSQLDTWDYGSFSDNLINELMSDLMGENNINFNHKKNDQHNDQHNDQQINNPQKHIKRFPDQAPPVYTTDTFRLIQPSVWASMTASQFTCSSCGMFFQEQNVYSDHIAWHKRINTAKLEKEQLKNSLSENHQQQNNDSNKVSWYYDIDDWIHYRHSSDDIPFHLLPPLIQQEKLKIRFFEDQQNRHLLEDDQAVKDFWERKEMSLLYENIKPYDKTNQINIFTILQKASTKIIAKARSEQKKKQSTGGNNDDYLDNTHDGDGGDGDDDDDGDDDNDDGQSSGQSELYRLPYYNPITQYDSVSAKRLLQKPQQLSDGSDNNNAGLFGSGGNQKNQKNQKNKKNVVFCVFCSEQIKTHYHDNEDAWVYGNSLVLSYDTILKLCTQFFLTIRQFRFAKQSAMALHLKNLGKRGKDEKNDILPKLEFSKDEHIAIEKLLKPLLKQYSTERFNNHLIHYKPCFHSILKASMEASVEQ